MLFVVDMISAIYAKCTPMFCHPNLQTHRPVKTMDAGVYDMRALLYAKDVEIRRLQAALGRLDRENEVLRSKLDKFQCVFSLSTPGGSAQVIHVSVHAHTARTGRRTRSSTQSTHATPSVGGES
jgi:hypothetical protein